jgi:predicted secreted hydrolase
VRRGRALVFPRDHGAHLLQRIEWWYATGWLLPEGSGPGPGSGAGVGSGEDSWAEAQDTQRIGFQVTFFRSRTGLAEALPGRFAPRHLLFAHAALTEVRTARHPHAQRLARWSGENESPRRDRASLIDTDLALGEWKLKRQPGPQAGRWRAAVDGLEDAPGRQRLVVEMTATQPVLLQGEAGFSRKGPQEAQASHYYSVPQLEAVARWEGDTTTASSRPMRGRAWLDHEWSDELLHPQAVGWDWIGMNLADGSALTAFVLRRADGTTLWAGGSLRRAGGAVQAFGPQEVRWSPGRRWRSPASGATYPVEWAVDCPAGRFTVQALADAQELDSRASTGTVYWEGLSALRDAQGRRVGLGYLEMTGYAGRLAL